MIIFLIFLENKISGDQEVADSIPPGPAYFFVKTYHAIFSMVISLPLIQVGQLSVSGKRMSTNTG